MYLGVPIGLKRLVVLALQPILEKVRKKLLTWKAKALLFADRVTLLKVLLQSISFT